MIPNEPARSPLSDSLAWAARINSIGFAFALPALGGWWLDRWLGTEPWLLLVGSGLGFATGMVQLLRIGRVGTRTETQGKTGEGETEEKHDGRT